MNILEKIKQFGIDNNSEFNISGKKSRRIFYRKIDAYKIITSGKDDNLFNKLCDFLVQDKNKCIRFESTLCGYKATYIDSKYILEIEKNFNGYDTICVYKN